MNREMRKRATEIVTLFKKIKNLNLGIMEFDEMVEFRKICNQYIKDGIQVHGNIPILGTNRIICYDFNHRVNCYLKYDEKI